MNLTASILHLDRAAIKALRITDSYSLHRVVYSLYEDSRSRAEKAASLSSGILYADQGGDFNSRKILLLANRIPSEQAEGGHGQVVSKPINDNFLTHERYRFKVIVNPTKRDPKRRESFSEQKSRSGKLIPLKGREAVATWFAERAPASWGFAVSLEHLQVDRIDVLQFNDKAQNPVTLAQAHISGQLQVTDQTLFQKSFAQGIGRGRAFGCGLLQIIPLIDNPFA
ncbi:CRISPR-associated protein, Cse3 family [Nitrosomonas eutropha]|uniref:type I-E CRISPR-associated protein Cas6/Cse3/CasE n=1 Tax=Nitrosomonas eutropha TaxID=916 RepID=UPI00088B21FD|nr:type I-E CRISPR-associated protein Cas6/Cse3/CasE [Nitrosomonas eutropha]SCX10071.1 CRISPR-associated protein, Cse3 family [Nitrosomonas eutropha]